MSNRYRGPCIYASHQFLVYLGKQFQRRRFLEIDQSKTRIACGGHVCKRIGTKWAIWIDGIPYMLPSKFRFIWARSFRGEDLFLNWSIRKKNCLWWPCLQTDWDKMSNLYREPSINAKCPVSIHLAMWFQKRRFTCEKLTNDGRRSSSDGKSSLCFVKMS